MSQADAIVIPNLMARVWNDSDHDHIEKFKGDTITIPAHGFVEMEYYDAVNFKGQFTPSQKNDSGEWLRVKKIRVEKLRGDAKDPTVRFVCQADGKQFATRKELDEYMEANKGKFQLQKHEELDQKQPDVTTAMTSLMDMVSKLSNRLEALESKPKKGRPKRDASGDNRSSETV